MREFTQVNTIIGRNNTGKSTVCLADLSELVEPVGSPFREYVPRSVNTLFIDHNLMVSYGHPESVFSIACLKGVTPFRSVIEVSKVLSKIFDPEIGMLNVLPINSEKF